MYIKLENYTAFFFFFKSSFIEQIDLKKKRIISLTSLLNLKSAFIM